MTKPVNTIDMIEKIAEITIKHRTLFMDNLYSRDIDEIEIEIEEALDSFADELGDYQYEVSCSFTDYKVHNFSPVRLYYREMFNYAFTSIEEEQDMMDNIVYDFTKENIKNMFDGIIQVVNDCNSYFEGFRKANPVTEGIN